MDSRNIEGFEGQTKPDPWQNPTDTAKEIKVKQQPVDYSRILGDNKVMFLAENHANHSIRQHLARHAQDLKAAGITHYAIEAPDKGKEAFDRLFQGESVNLSRVNVGPGRTDYEDAIYAMNAEGIKVVPIDIDQTTKPSKEKREAYMTANLERILKDPSAKVAVLIGSFHTSRHYISEGVPSVGRRLMEKDVPIINVFLAGGEVKDPTILTDAVSRSGLGNQEFMLDFHPYAGSDSVSYGKGEADWVIHLPQIAGNSGFGDLAFSDIDLARLTWPNSRF